jgi:hypothetical protein
MNKNDFENCDSNMPEFTENDLKDDAINFKNYLKSLPNNESELIHEKKAYKTSFRSNSGILLRSFLVLKNVGTTDLNVFSVMFDGEPCFSRGIELVDCSPFTIETYPKNIYLLEVRYRPDFTMSLIRKSLTVATNIGDLEYLIEIKGNTHTEEIFYKEHIKFEILSDSTSYTFDAPTKHEKQSWAGIINEILCN